MISGGDKLGLAGRTSCFTETCLYYSGISYLLAVNDQSMHSYNVEPIYWQRKAVVLCCLDYASFRGRGLIMMMLLFCTANKWNEQAVCKIMIYVQHQRYGRVK